MRHVGVALGIVCGLVLIFFAAAYLVSGDIHVAEGAGTLPFLGCVHIAEMLDRRETRSGVAAASAATIPTFKDFRVRWSIVVLYGTLAMWAIDFFSGFFGGAVIEIVDDQDSLARSFAVLCAATPIELVAGFMVGRWIGIRCERWPRAAVVLVAFAGALLSNGLGETTNWLVGGGPELMRNWAIDFAAFIAISFAQLGIAGLVGEAVGRRRKLSAYLNYLMSVLPPATSNILVSLAYEEAQKRVTRSGLSETKSNPAA
jgi:hypothetical protein